MRALHNSLSLTHTWTFPCRYDLEELELDDVFDDSRSHRSGNLSQPNLTNTAPAANQPVNRRASVDSALEQEKRKSLSDSNNDGSGYVRILLSSLHPFRSVLGKRERTNPATMIYTLPTSFERPRRVWARAGTTWVTTSLKTAPKRLSQLLALLPIPRTTAAARRATTPLLQAVEMGRYQRRPC